MISYCSFIVQAHFTICDFFSQCCFRSQAACPPSDTCTTALHFTHLIVFSKLSSEENALEKPFFSSCSRIRSTVGDPSTERCQERRKRKTITIRIIFPHSRFLVDVQMHVSFDDSQKDKAFRQKQLLVI